MQPPLYATRSGNSARMSRVQTAARLCLATSLLFLSGCIANLANDPERRTPGVVIDDNVLEALVSREIRRSDSAGFKGSHIAVLSYNGVVLLTGQVPSEALRTQATEVTQGLRKVRKVHNEMSIGGPTSLVARSNDAWLTTKVKTRLIASKRASGTKVKVQTENGVVYLMGLLPREDADIAVDVARKVYGVQKIVKVFEYLD